MLNWQELPLFASKMAEIQQIVLNAVTIQERLLFYLGILGCGYNSRAGIIQERVLITRVLLRSKKTILNNKYVSFIHFFIIEIKRSTQLNRVCFLWRFFCSNMSFEKDQKLNSKWRDIFGHVHFGSEWLLHPAFLGVHINLLNPMVL